MVITIEQSQPGETIVTFGGIQVEPELGKDSLGLLVVLLSFRIVKQLS